MTTQYIYGFIGGLGTWEVLLIVVAILVLFGANKIPQFMRGLGQGVREFKNAANDIKTEIERQPDNKDKSGK